MRGLVASKGLRKPGQANCNTDCNFSFLTTTRLPLTSPLHHPPFSSPHPPPLLSTISALVIFTTMSPLGLPFFRKASTDSHNTITSQESSSSTSLVLSTPRTELPLSPSQSSLHTTAGTVDSIPYSGRISPTAYNQLGFGKVVADGGYLSVHTLGVLNGKQLDATTNVIRTDTTQRLTELRQGMKQEPESLDY